MGKANFSDDFKRDALGRSPDRGPFVGPVPELESGIDLGLRLIGPTSSVDCRNWRGQDGFGSWWSVSQGAVRPDGIVMLAPLLDQDLGIAERTEDLAVEQLIPEAGVAAFDVAILPR